MSLHEARLRFIIQRQVTRARGAHSFGHQGSAVLRRTVAQRSMVTVFVAMLFAACSRDQPAPSGDSTRAPSRQPQATNSAPGAPPASPTPTGAGTVIALGDIASCDSSGDEQTAALVATLRGTILTLGDTAYESGTADEFRECFEPAWGPLKSRILPVPGNHEYRTEGASGYFEYFGRLAGPPDHKGWYATDIGEWRIYSLNSNCNHAGGCGPGSRQYEWLKSDLAANPRACVLAYWHHPKFTQGPHADDEGGSGAAFWPLLYSAGADIVLNGHDHYYQRFAPQTPGGTADAVNGIREFVVGTGGKNLTHPNRSEPNVEATDDKHYGALVLQLGDGGYSWMFIADGGTVIDNGSSDCH